MWNRPENPERKSGDDGLTYLGTSERVPKTHSRIVVAGELDELNCHIGLLGYETQDGDLCYVLAKIQDVLHRIRLEFLGETAKPVDQLDLDVVNEHFENITRYREPMEKYLIPDGSKAMIMFYLAGSVCRRVERNAWRAHNFSEDQTSINKVSLVYLNRLSSFLLALSRSGY